MNLRGVIFDLDGTLIDSGLDFDVIRREMGLPAGQPVLEELATKPEGTDKHRLRAILRRHELLGAERATLMPHVEEFLDELTRRGLRRAVVTRNSRESTDLVLGRLRLSETFDPVLTREECPPKPDPAGLLRVCRQWKASPSEVLFFGDFVFDLQAGNRAGIRTVLYAPHTVPDFAGQADFTISCFAEAVEWLSGAVPDSPA